ncbi:MAG: hypothetical protein ACP5G0_06495 [Desulfomonilia bacterium]
MKVTTGAKIVSIAVCLCIFPGVLFSAVVRISWNQNTETDLAGYKVYYGTSTGSYCSVLNVGMENRVDVSGFEEQQTYVFAVTAYDRSHNESAFSEEASITIPIQESGIIHTFIQFFINAFEWVFRIDPDVPLFSIDEFSSIGETVRPVPTSAVVSEDSSSPPVPRDADEAYDWGLPLRDVVMDILDSVDLQPLYPDQYYFFLPLDDFCPLIEGGYLSAYELGPFLYVVYDEMGDAIQILRVSVAEELYAVAELAEDVCLNLSDPASGVSLSIPSQELRGSIPIAIGWGGDERFPASAQLPEGSSVVEFDILPYGLVLDEPAVISVALEGAHPFVERYDEESGEWIECEGVSSTDGLITFSSEVLGRFKASTVPQEEEHELEWSGVACFLECSSPGDSLPGSFMLILGLVIVCLFRPRRP